MRDVKRRRQSAGPRNFPRRFAALLPLSAFLAAGLVARTGETRQGTSVPQAAREEGRSVLDARTWNQALDPTATPAAVPSPTATLTPVPSPSAAPMPTGTPLVTPTPEPNPDTLIPRRTPKVAPR